MRNRHVMVLVALFCNHGVRGKVKRPSTDHDLSSASTLRPSSRLAETWAIRIWAPRARPVGVPSRASMIRLSSRS